MEIEIHKFKLVRRMADALFVLHENGRLPPRPAPGTQAVGVLQGRNSSQGAHPAPFVRMKSFLVASRIELARGSIVFFMSESWRQVTPVGCDSDDFGAGRFVLSGHIHSGAAAAGP